MIAAIKLAFLVALGPSILGKAPATVAIVRSTLETIVTVLQIHPSRIVGLRVVLVSTFRWMISATDEAHVTCRPAYVLPVIQVTNDTHFVTLHGISFSPPFFRLHTLKLKGFSGDQCETIEPFVTLTTTQAGYDPKLQQYCEAFPDTNDQCCFGTDACNFPVNADIEMYPKACRGPSICYMGTTGATIKLGESACVSTTNQACYNIATSKGANIEIQKNACNINNCCVGR